MKSMSSVKKSCVCAICIALCYVLPVAFHALGVGNAFSPMHLPVLLCGLLLGPGYGGFCGIAGPLISASTGMPSFVQCLYMVPELFVYGLTAGALMRHIHTRRLTLDVLLCLIPAMVLGRIAGGLARMAVIRVLSTGEAFGLAVWVSAYFAGTLPGIVLQLVALPVLVLTLEKARVIPPRYIPQGGMPHG